MQRNDGTEQKDGAEQVKRLVGAIICNATTRWHAIKSNVWWEQSHVMQQQDGTQQKDGTQQLKHLMGAIIGSVSDLYV